MHWILHWYSSQAPLTSLHICAISQYKTSMWRRGILAQKYITLLFPWPPEGLSFTVGMKLSLGHERHDGITFQQLQFNQEQSWLCSGLLFFCFIFIYHIIITSLIYHIRLQRYHEKSLAHWAVKNDGWVKTFTKPSSAIVEGGDRFLTRISSRLQMFRVFLSWSRSYPDTRSHNLIQSMILDFAFTFSVMNNPHMDLTIS